MGSRQTLGGGMGASLAEWNGVDTKMSDAERKHREWADYHKAFYARKDFNPHGSSCRKFDVHKRCPLPTITSWVGTAHSKPAYLLREGGITGYSIFDGVVWRFPSPAEAARTLGVCRAALSTGRGDTFKYLHVANSVSQPKAAWTGVVAVTLLSAMMGRAPKSVPVQISEVMGRLWDRCRAVPVSDMESFAAPIKVPDHKRARPGGPVEAQVTQCYFNSHCDEVVLADKSSYGQVQAAVARVARDGGSVATHVRLWCNGLRVDQQHLERLTSFIHIQDDNPADDVALKVLTRGAEPLDFVLARTTSMACVFARLSHMLRITDDDHLYAPDTGQLFFDERMWNTGFSTQRMETSIG